MGELKKRVCLVTGGSKGIGEGIVKELINEGAFVVNFDKSPPAYEEKRVDYFCGDVCEETLVREVIKYTVEKFGRIDVMVNNAGVSLVAPAVETEIEDWERVIKVNLTGVFLFCKHVIPIMRAQKKGAIINIASPVAISPMKYLSCYAASKAGVIAFTKTLSLEEAPYNIRANSVCPGFVKTEIWEYTSKCLAEIEGKKPEDIITDIENSIPLGRGGKPEDIAKMVVFLASDRASWVTGQTICVNGGDVTY